MCCFSRPVKFVASTFIFARARNGRQQLVYQMKYGADTDLAMILPLPVPARSHERSVRFINLERYPNFFTDMNAGFPEPAMTRGFGSVRVSVSAPAKTLKVHEVGSFDASFVPHADDFDRLDERFRIGRDIWDKVPGYADFGFAVFKLKPTKETRVHPMALEFPRRDLERVFFPTVHVHDGKLHDSADYDHALYCQGDPQMERFLEPHWQESMGGASRFMQPDRTEGIVDPNLSCWRRRLGGTLPNADSWVGKDGLLPVDLLYAPPGEPSNAAWVLCADCGLRRQSSAQMQAGIPCPRCGGAVA
jgi:hypothetical protein